MTILISVLCLIGWFNNCLAQDPRERNYMYSVLKPNHQEKPQINGWATSRVTEPLNRGFNAIQTDNGIYFTWRWLVEDEPTKAFNIYKLNKNDEKELITTEPVSTTCDFLYPAGKKNIGSSYTIIPVVNNKEIHEEAESCTISASCTVIKLKGDYTPNRIAVADLNGDGKYDYIVKQPGYSIDPAHAPDTRGTTYKIEAYLSDGTFLWQNDLGPGIEPGIWYSPFIAYDFNGDGKAEIAVKTSTETKRDDNGRITSGPEYVSIWDGLTGKELARANWPERSPRFGAYNRTNRNQMGVAFLDGKTPCVLVARGTYRLMVLDAYQFHDNKLDMLWHWDGDEENPVIRNQGAHGMHCADVDEDGRDEVILGSVTIDDNGTALWSTGYAHPDKCYVSDIDPSNPGLEIFYAIENWHDDGNGVCLVKAATGENLWNIGHKTWHVGDGMVADILPEEPGLECFASEDSKGGSSDKYLLSSTGKYLAKNDGVPACRNWIYWDEDLLRENITGGGWRSNTPLSIVEYQGNTFNVKLEGRIMMMADITGDWREELITTQNGELRIYHTTIPAIDKRASLMQDHVYRIEVAHRSMGYEQSPVTGYYLGM